LHRSTPTSARKKKSFRYVKLSVNFVGEQKPAGGTSTGVNNARGHYET